MTDHIILRIASPNTLNPEVHGCKAAAASSCDVYNCVTQVIPEKVKLYWVNK